MTLLNFVKHVTFALPNSLLYKSFRTKRVKLNGKAAAQNTRLALNDLIELYINDEFFELPKPKKEVAGNLPYFGTVYEDENLAILFKPKGLLSHPGAKNDASLIDAFCAYLANNNSYNPLNENTFSPALCNRLDAGTEGLVIAAKCAQALREINQLIKLGLVCKSYLCVCCGRPPQGVFTAFLRRDKQRKTVFITAESAADAKPIKTGINVLFEENGLCLCQIELYTGRTHQIRAHLAFLGAPVLGDAKYGSPGMNTRHKAKTQLLCAFKICFDKNLQSALLKELAGKCFEAKEATLPMFWENHCKNR